MKQILVCILLLSMVIMPDTQVSASEIPSTVLESFQQKYPEAKEVSWTKVDNQFIAAFFQKDAYLKLVSFDTEGQ